MRDNNNNFPNLIEAFFVIVFLFAAEYVIGAAMFDLRPYSQLHSMGEGSIVTLMANAIVILTLMDYKGLSYRELFHASSSSAAATLLVLTLPIVLTIPALMLFVQQAVGLLEHLIPLSGYEEAMFEELGSGTLGAIVLTCILAPVLEEMLFRGIILRSFLVQYSTRKAIIASAVLFGLAHMNIYQFVVGLVLGTVTGWLYEKTRSLLPCIVLHGVYNTTLMVVGLNGDERIFDSLTHPSPSIVIIAALSCAAGVVWLRRWLRTPSAGRIERR
jgi:uncharacterized protein